MVWFPAMKPPVVKNWKLFELIMVLLKTPIFRRKLFSLDMLFFLTLYAAISKSHYDTIMFVIIVIRIQMGKNKQKVK